MDTSFLARLGLENLFPALNIPQQSAIQPYDHSTKFLGGNSTVMPPALHPALYAGMNEQKPMDVVYKPPASDQIADNILGVGPGQLTDKDKAALGLKSRALDQADTKISNTDNINQQKLGISQQRADVYEFKAKNPGIKIVAPKGGSIQAINSATGELIKDFGPSGTLSDEDRINLEQTGKETLADRNNTARETLSEINARHAQELSDHKASLNTGTTKTETVTDATGNKVGTRTTSSRPNSATAVPKVGDIKTFPNGKKAKFDGKGWAEIPAEVK